MNALLTSGSGDLWQVAGWTMLHFLWLGTLAALAAGACRVVLRRAAANVRYVAALVCLAVLVALPVAIAGWVGAKPQPMRAAENSVITLSDEIALSAPGFARGHTAAPREIGPTAIAPVNSVEADFVSNPQANSRPTRTPGAPRGLMDVTASIAGYLPWVWIIGTPLTFVLLATGVVGAERLRRASHVIKDGPIADACAQLVESLRISRSVTVAVCERIAAPVLVGIIRPIILLPPAALTGWSPDEIEMVLLHELAHVRHWDNLINLAQRFIESLLFFHPAVWLVSNWVRREREACCDALVVGRTNRPHAYAEMLVALAAQLPRSVLFHPAATSAMAAGPLRGRIHRILSLDDDPMLISGKSLGVVMSGLLLAATLVVLNLSERTTAEEPDEREDGKIATKAVDQELVRQVEVTNQLKYLGLALHWYHDTKGSFPANASYDTFGRPLLSWRVHILPYLDGNAAEDGEAAALYKEFHLDEPWDSEHNRTLIARMPAVFKNPNKPGTGFTNYLAAVGDDCVFGGTAKGISLAQIPDGTGNTIMLVEADEGVEWTRPADLKFNPAIPKVGLGERRPNGWIAVFADGSVKLIDKDEPANKVHDLFTRGRQDTRAATQPAAPNERAQVPPPEDPTFAEVPFVAGATRFSDGDSITIVEVRGTADVFEPGNIYWIKGTYRLGSHDGATLAAYTTAMDAANGTSPSLSVQSTHVDRGEGTFTLFLPMSYRGWPHVSFYPADGGQSFGGTYFGTGDSVLKQWWGSNEVLDATATSVTDSTESQDSAASLDEAGLTLKVAAAQLDETANELLTDKVEIETPHGHAVMEADGDRIKLRGQFPSLEDQKLADLAWKCLGIELEEIEPSDAKRAQQFGYEGGLKVSSVTDRKIGQPMQEGDILVGLHVWPTKSLKDLAAVLTRPDIGELSPLKYYLVRAEPVEDGMEMGAYGGRMAGPIETKDAVRSGRISVGLSESPPQRATASERYSVPATRTPASTATPWSVPSDPWPTAERAQPAEPSATPYPIAPATPSLPPAAPATAIVPPTRASDEEIAALRQHVEILERQHKKIDEQYRGGAKHVGPMREMTAYELALSQGELFSAEGSRDAALDRFQEASKQAETALKSVTKEYEANRITQDVLLQAARNVTNIKRRILQLEKPGGLIATPTPAQPSNPVGRQPVLVDRAQSTATPRPTLDSSDTKLPVPTIPNAVAPQATVALPPMLPPAKPVAPTASVTVAPGPAPTTVVSAPKVGAERKVDRESKGIPANVQAKLRERGPMGVVLFYVDDSEACQRTQDVLNNFEREYLNLPVNVLAKNAQAERGLAVTYNIERVPALLFFDQDNKLLEKTYGDLTAAEFTELLGEVAEKLPAGQAPAGTSANSFSARLAENVAAIGNSNPLQVECYVSRTKNSMACRKLESSLHYIQSAYPGLLKLIEIDIDFQPALAASRKVKEVPSLLSIKGDQVISVDTNLDTQQLAEKLVEIVRGKSIPEQGQAEDFRYDGNTFDQWRRVWNVDGMANSKLEALAALEAFAGAGYGQQAAAAIAYGVYSNERVVAQQTRKCLSKLSADDKRALAARFIEVLKTDLSAKRRTAAARALAAIGSDAAPALETLKKTLASADPQERIASAAAIKMIVGKDQYQKPVAEVLGEELGITVVESNGVWGALPLEDANDGGKAFNDFTEAVIKEQQGLLPKGSE